MPLSEVARNDEVRIITRQKLNLIDYQWSVSNLLKDSDAGFEIEKSGSRLLPYKN